MEIQQALDIVRKLVSGVQPETGGGLEDTDNLRFQSHASADRERRLGRHAHNFDDSSHPGSAKAVALMLANMFPLDGVFWLRQEHRIVAAPSRTPPRIVTTLIIFLSVFVTVS